VLARPSSQHAFVCFLTGCLSIFPFEQVPRQVKSRRLLERFPERLRERRRLTFRETARQPALPGSCAIKLLKIQGLAIVFSYFRREVCFVSHHQPTAPQRRPSCGVFFAVGWVSRTRSVPVLMEVRARLVGLVFRSPLLAVWRGRKDGTTTPPPTLRCRKVAVRDAPEQRCWQCFGISAREYFLFRLCFKCLISGEIGTRRFPGGGGWVSERGRAFSCVVFGHFFAAGAGAPVFSAAGVAYILTLRTSYLFRCSDVSRSWFFRQLWRVVMHSVMYRHVSETQPLYSIEFGTSCAFTFLRVGGLVSSLCWHVLCTLSAWIMLSLHFGVHSEPR